MTDEFIRSRITELRIKNGVSEYKMSRDMGHSNGYIQGISSGRALPSLSEFLYMCEYFGITPRDFFDEENANPTAHNEICEQLKYLTDADLDIVKTVVARLKDNN